MNIKIVICFIIIWLLPVASAGTTDVWAARYSGFIQSNQSVSFENYGIIARTLGDTKAAISVYKDQNLIETRDFSVNEFRRYDAIGITLLGIKGAASWISISKLENKDIWRPLTRAQLKWGETYTIENYTFNIDTFGSDSVNLIVSNNSLAETNAFSINSLKDYGNLRIAVKDINRTGFIELEFFTNKADVIKAEVLTDKNEYFPDEPVQVTINAASDFVQNIVGIALESSPPAGIQPDSFSSTGVTGTRSFQSQITQKPANSTVTIRAKIETRDYYNNAYITTASKDILITPEVSIIKRAPADTDDENVTVQLYVYNSGFNNKSIHIHDVIPEELTAKELDRDIELGPKKSTNITYYVTPQKPGLYFLPAATAQWNGQSAMSQRVRMTVHMPYISMTKTAVKTPYTTPYKTPYLNTGNKSQTDVKLVISNTGDRPAQAKVSDKIPQGYSIVSGDTAWSGKLEGGESAAIMYSLQGNIEELPEADATYRDMRGAIRNARSNTIEQKAKGISAGTEKKEEPSTLNSEPYEIMSFMISSFIAIAGIITGATLIAYLFARYKRRR